MPVGRYALTSKPWRYQGNGAWIFVTIPKKESADIAKRFAKKKRGWGSLRVEATIGDTTWQTSIFPDSKSGTYLLPLKVAVRRTEGVEEGESLAYSIRIR